ncbi:MULTISPECIES: LexA family protein [Stenotrophomonas]|jgi:DNA polymerase V|uniref:LexA family protein n=1 Tax=Stenotrophomonas TaxID=40323 RepID=UPI0002C53CEF|nr:MULTISPECIES: translesion error-prone DNA polymerase V autoproteolytic subunit [Stenotrophomonas]MCO7468603.1 translesion error-prone DNA polymerase V autoproteolytic subunit [Stenotrophomonas maltophilia]UQY96145.1 translesion error-prone DNA polymerase V autoproteolytic subunit [Stenotrophomonas maltophilia]CCP17204.1 LexA repressor [Stenotrophomonas maltophilia RA8]
MLDTTLPPGYLGPANLHATPLPLLLLPVRATCGFPSPAEDFYGSQDVLDINQRVVRNPVATFYVEADTGTSMVEFGIFPGDTLVVDRSLTARHGDIVMVCWEGGFTVKQLRLRAGRYELHSGNPANAPIVVPEDVELDVWGVVTWSFRKQWRR